jgi:hypothetical protein
LRKDTVARWTEVGPILMEGEFALKTNTRKAKMGDEVRNYNDLQYISFVH